MKEKWRLRLSGAMAAAMGVLLLSPQADGLARLPGQMIMRTGSAAVLSVSTAVSTEIQGASVEAEEGEGALRLRADAPGEAQLRFRLLGLVPIKTVNVSVQPERRLVPGGQSVGVALNTAGVVVVGASDLGRTPSPARLAGLKSGDVIQSIDGEAITSAAQLSTCLTDGAAARLQVLRNGKRMECEITPAQDTRDGQWRLGAWVRDSTAGVGTLTFYDPETGGFGALGHAITDVDTGVVMPTGVGEVYANQVVQVTPSERGTPGELTGDFLSAAQRLGSVTKNTDYGLFGTLDVEADNPLYPEGLPIGDARQIHTGSAQLLTTVEGDEVQTYDCEIVRVSEHPGKDAKDMTIRITDRSLLDRTGGIVQGMSGSPLIQDGRIIGAVTHVMVNDPTMGYGISIESMLNAMDAGGTTSQQAA